MRSNPTVTTSKEQASYTLAALSPCNCTVRQGRIDKKLSSRLVDFGAIEEGVGVERIR